MAATATSQRSFSNHRNMGGLLTFRRTDSLPPSIDASAYRARPSGAALPLYEGENKAAYFWHILPLREGGRERSERWRRLCRVLNPIRATYADPKPRQLRAT